MSVREPAVAGTFYPSNAEALRRQLGDLMPARDRRAALAVLVPHAGYAYSGRVAGEVFAGVRVTPDVVLLSFNHRGEGAEVALWSGGAWRTPLGEAAIADGLLGAIERAFPRARRETACFLGEHSGEVQVPFLQFARADVRIAPVSLNTEDEEVLKAVARALASAAPDALVVATTDLTHVGAGYGIDPPPGTSPREWARRQDAAVLDRVSALDADGFRRDVRDRGVTMCGVAPTHVMIAYARVRGASSATVVRYATSADDEPEADRAVGYPGIVVYSPPLPSGT